MKLELNLTKYNGFKIDLAGSWNGEASITYIIRTPGGMT